MFAEGPEIWKYISFDNKITEGKEFQKLRLGHKLLYIYFFDPTRRQFNRLSVIYCTIK
jgi:hypothetical protein